MSTRAFSRIAVALAVVLIFAGLARWCGWHAGWEAGVGFMLAATIISGFTVLRWAIVDDTSFGE